MFLLNLYVNMMILIEFRLKSDDFLIKELARVSEKQAQDGWGLLKGADWGIPYRGQRALILGIHVLLA